MQSNSLISQNVAFIWDAEFCNFAKRLSLICESNISVISKRLFIPPILWMSPLCGTFVYSWREGKGLLNRRLLHLPSICRLSWKCRKREFQLICTQWNSHALKVEGQGGEGGNIHSLHMQHLATVEEGQQRTIAMTAVRVDWKRPK